MRRARARTLKGIFHIVAVCRTRGACAGQLAPQQRRQGEAEEEIQHAPSEVGVHLRGSPSALEHNGQVSSTRAKDSHWIISNTQVDAYPTLVHEQLRAEPVGDTLAGR